MRISYKKKHLTINLIFGVIWFIFGLLGIFFKEDPFWTDYGYLVLSLFYLALYFYLKKHQYINIENEVLSINGFLGKKINLKDIKQIKKFAGDYIIKSDKKELTINTQIIDSASLIKLNTELRKLTIEWK